MDSKILYEKDGMKFTKLENKKYRLSFSMENISSSTSVGDPDPNWIRIQQLCGIRIPNSDTGMDSHN